MKCLYQVRKVSGHVFVLEISIVPWYTIFLLDFWAVLTVWDFSVGFLSCSDSVVFFSWIFELFWQCGIFLLDFWAVPTVWYFSVGFLRCSNSLVIFELFRQFDDFLGVPTVWWFLSCSDSLVIFEVFGQFSIFCFSFYYNIIFPIDIVVL